MQEKPNRKIFYIPGFDPRSENYYKKLLLNEFPEIKASINNEQREKNRIQFSGNLLNMDYEILSWHQCVKNHWLSGIKGNAINVYDLFLHFIFRGGYWRGSKVTMRDAIQKAFSIYFFTAWFVLALLSLFFGVMPLFAEQSTVVGMGGMLVWLLLNYAIYLALERIHIFWVTRIMRFFALYAKQEVPDVFAKETEFLAKITSALKDEQFDEVILVGHSVGSILALSLAAELNKIEACKKLRLVTLGHCVTGVSVVKEAQWFNQKLASLAERSFFWVDVTSGKDAVNFYKVNPAFNTSAKPDLILSAGFHKAFKADFYKSLRWDFYKVHFLYLYKLHQPEAVDFDYQRLLFDPTLFTRLEGKIL